MRKTSAALLSGLIATAAFSLPTAVGAPMAQASTRTSTTSLSARAPASVPNYTANVTLKVRCGKFVGVIRHGGTGGLLNRAYLQVEGKLSSSCNSTTYLEVRYDSGPQSFPGTVIKTVGARRTVNVDWETHSIEGPYGHIGARVGTSDGMPKGKVFWGPWKNV